MLVLPHIAIAETQLKERIQMSDSTENRIAGSIIVLFGLVIAGLFYWLIRITLLPQMAFMVAMPLILTMAGWFQLLCGTSFDELQRTIESRKGIRGILQWMGLLSSAIAFLAIVGLLANQLCDFQ